MFIRALDYCFNTEYNTQTIQLEHPIKFLLQTLQSDILKISNIHEHKL